MAEPVNTSKSPEEPIKPSLSGFRRLFLDDDPARAEAFLEKYPDANWVQNVVDCIAALTDSTWDEIHLDHDLAGEWFVDSERQDCGMEVVRWLTTEPRTHLMAAKFVVHSHNSNAAMVMVTQLGLTGYYVVEQPFGTARQELTGVGGPIFEEPVGEGTSKSKKEDEFLRDEPETKPGLIKRILRWFVPPPTSNKPWNLPPGFGTMPNRDRLGTNRRETGTPGDDFEDSEESDGPFVFPIQENDPESYRDQVRRRPQIRQRKEDQGGYGDRFES